ncbi:hypothetical protein MmiEs2_04020 [Methanimicrococcus stummii]|uniref:Peptidase S1 domain-containing protein n=1 Tax=Methanimicrococcus stummii TaxID=3028294 RepID=A0AA96VAE3_9EURY|nr:hypothetical protein [Methanimicrococcus sp. Es2]WNY28218.1 hypothetical protein MmiEs2_04020 [Methanimicrococcus sp. Es2]
MKKKILIIFFILLSFSGIALGTEYLDENPFTVDEQIAEIIKNNYSLNPKIFEDLKKSENTIAIYGEIPDKKSGMESYKWWVSICNISESMAIDGALKEYSLINNGPVFGFGPENSGYILVYIDVDYEKKISDKELLSIRKTIEKYALNENIAEIPIVISYEEMPELEYERKHRPLVGGVKINNQTQWIGTSGYSVKKGNINGFVTAAHCVDYTNMTVYQPSFSSNNSVGTSTITYEYIDATFVPYNNVNASIYFENDSYPNGTNLSVGGYYSIKSVNDTVWKSGTTTGLTQGNLTGYLYGYQTSGDGPEVFIMGKIVPHISDGGDSGSPIFVIRGDGKAYLVGVLHGGIGEFNVDGHTYFTPTGEINERLGVVPLMR